jgi:hypothetical protein
MTEKRGFFGNKKVSKSITKTGVKVLNAKKQELDQEMQKLSNGITMV